MKSKTTAWILAILLGGIGIHKFYLWKSGQGILYILFVWTYVPLIISVIEAIKYFFMDKDRFDALYNAEYLRNMDYINNRK